MKKTMGMVGALALALVAGCDGGGELEVDAAASVREVPVSAQASARAYAEFAGTLAVDDRGDPMEVGPVVAPTSETDEPVDID
jgi:hypothetical protein